MLLLLLALLPALPDRVELCGRAGEAASPRASDVAFGDGESGAAPCGVTVRALWSALPGLPCCCCCCCFCCCFCCCCLSSATSLLLSLVSSWVPWSGRTTGSVVLALAVNGPPTRTDCAVSVVSKPYSSSDENVGDALLPSAVLASSLSAQAS